MKAKVLIRFYDIAAKTVREEGDIFDVTPFRFNEISRKGGFLEAAEDSEMTGEEFVEDE